jgi:hypothetical protein
MYVCIYVLVCVSVFMHVCMIFFLLACVCMYACMYLVCVCVCVCVQVSRLCIYTHTHTNTNANTNTHTHTHTHTYTHTHHYAYAHTHTLKLRDRDRDREICRHLLVLLEGSLVFLGIELQGIGICLMYCILHISFSCFLHAYPNESRSCLHACIKVNHTHIRVYHTPLLQIHFLASLLQCKSMHARTKIYTVHRCE